MRLALSALAAGSIALAGCAADQMAQAPAATAHAADATTHDSCFRMSQIRNHRIAKPDTIYLRVGFKDFYELKTKGTCGASAFPDDALITSTVAGSDIVCKPLDLDVKIRRGAGFSSPCIIDSITRMTPEQVAALPPKLKP